MVIETKEILHVEWMRQNAYGSGNDLIGMIFTRDINSKDIELYVGTSFGDEKYPENDIQVILRNGRKVREKVLPHYVSIFKAFGKMIEEKNEKKTE